jgi:hypothetical protein
MSFDRNRIFWFYKDTGGCFHQIREVSIIGLTNPRVNEYSKNNKIQQEILLDH